MRFLLLSALALVSFGAPLNAQKADQHQHALQVGPRPQLTSPTNEDFGPIFAGTKLPTIMLTGYWPPTNEAVRHFSTDPGKNPAGWIGANWEGRGYDVVSFFPEFNPPNCGTCGTGNGLLKVDYQDTVVDFWNLANEIKPIALITFSRGNPDLSWEVENNLFNHSAWFPDYVAPNKPNKTPPDNTFPANQARHSSLPVNRIVNDVNKAGLGLNPFVCFSGDAGGFLSEYIGYMGVWYQDIHSSPADPAWCLASGHIHVGELVTWKVAKQATEVSLRALISSLDAQRTANTCQVDLGFQGPGTAQLSMCGGDLSSGTTADVHLSGAKPDALAWIVFGGASPNPVPFFQGTLVTWPAASVFPMTLNPSGSFHMASVQGGGGSVTLTGQAVYLDADLPGGVGISNALSITLLP